MNNISGFSQFSLYDTGSTVGQQILGIYYGPQSKGANPTAGPAATSGKGDNPILAAGLTKITPREKILYALLMIICPWLKERISTLLSYLGFSQYDLEVRKYGTPI